jgi:hypothetical protein
MKPSTKRLLSCSVSPDLLFGRMGRIQGLSVLKSSKTKQGRPWRGLWVQDYYPLRLLESPISARSTLEELTIASVTYQRRRG